MGTKLLLGFGGTVIQVVVHLLLVVLNGEVVSEVR